MKKRQTELDILRLLALLAVVATHTCSGTIRTLPVTNTTWQIVNLFEAAITWSVPIYVMISGRFLLDPGRDTDITHMWKTSIWRLVRVFLIWSAVYQVYYIMDGQKLNWKGALSQYVIGPYHFWYLHMLIWLYAVMPFLRKIVEDRRLAEYFLGLFFIFHVLTYWGVNFPLVGGTIEGVLKVSNFRFAIGYTGYAVLGYYLYKYPISRKFEVWLYLAGIAMSCFTVVIVALRTAQTGSNQSGISTYPMPNVIIEAAALYTFFIKRVGKLKLSEKGQQFFAKTTEYGFGVYIVHGLVVELLGKLDILPIKILPVALVPACTLLVLSLSFGVSILLRKTPVIGKYIV